jgi:hypothetical protein
MTCPICNEPANGTVDCCKQPLCIDCVRNMTNEVCPFCRNVNPIYLPTCTVRLTFHLIKKIGSHKCSECKVYFYHQQCIKYENKIFCFKCHLSVVEKQFRVNLAHSWSQTMKEKMILAGMSKLHLQIWVYHGSYCDKCDNVVSKCFKCLRSLETAKNHLYCDSCYFNEWILKMLLEWHCSANSWSNAIIGLYKGKFENMINYTNLQMIKELTQLVKSNILLPQFINS